MSFVSLLRLNLVPRVGLLEEVILRPAYDVLAVEKMLLKSDVLSILPCATCAPAAIACLTFYHKNLK